MNQLFESLAADRAGCSMRALERKTGVSRVTLWRWQSGRSVPSLLAAQSVADALGLRLQELLDLLPVTSDRPSRPARRAPRERTRSRRATPAR